MARKPLISWYDWVRWPTGVILSGGSWTLPLTNLRDHNPQVVAQSTDSAVASSRFDIDLGADRSIGFMFLANVVRTSGGATIRVRAWDAVGTFVYDSGVGTIWAGDGNEWDALGRPRFFVPSAPITAKTISVDIDSSAVAGTVKVGVFGACEVIEPTHNLAFDWSVSYLDDSEILRVPGGSAYITEHPVRRRLNFALPNMPTGVELTNLRAMLAIKGRSEPITVVPFPDDATNLERLSVYGLIANEPAISNPFYAHYESAYAIDQLV